MVHGLSITRRCSERRELQLAVFVRLWIERAEKLGCSGPELSAALRASCGRVTGWSTARSLRTRLLDRSDGAWSFERIRCDDVNSED